MKYLKECKRIPLSELTGEINKQIDGMRAITFLITKIPRVMWPIQDRISEAVIMSSFRQ